jgi:hypothetical protein
MTYDLAKEVEDFVQQFDTETIDVVSMPKLKGSRKKLTKYQFSQKEMIAKIDMATLSQFETGHFDPDGKRKIYLNEVNFVVDVANKSSDIDSKNFIFTPEGYSKDNERATWLVSRQFKHYVKETDLADTINDSVSKFNTYGSVVAKECENDRVRVVPLQSFRCDQSAATLQEGIDMGGFAIIEYAYSYNQLQNYPDWTITENRYKGTKSCYEVYGMIPESALKKGTTNKEDDNYILVMAIIAPDFKDKVLYIEKVDKLPLIEQHDKKIEGRWLGIGEVEKQLENQVAKNLVANTKRRDTLWAAERKFYTKDVDVPKSLSREVEDGEILQVGINGEIIQIDTASRNAGDVNQFDSLISDNIRKTSFSFEVQTGESAPSGTPFRLGALLSNASQGYFNLKKQKIGQFWKKIMFELIMDDFKKSAKSDIQRIASGEEGYEMVKDLLIDREISNHYNKIVLSPYAFSMDLPNKDEVRVEIEKQILKEKSLVITDITNDIYDNAKWSFDIDITGESTEVADTETLTTLYTSLVQAGDPRAETVLSKILASKGKNLQTIAGSKPEAQPVQQQVPVNPNLQGLLPQ